MRRFLHRKDRGERGDASAKATFSFAVFAFHPADSIGDDVDQAALDADNLADGPAGDGRFGVRGLTGSRDSSSAGEVRTRPHPPRRSF